MKTPGNTQKDHDGPEPANYRDIQMEYSPDELYSPSIATVTKNYL
jgi:hypothetical protein